ncbi:MAG: hypothetical protein KDE14_14210 [Rhodobacteraceae bacterium]|nr:hypothetical protein [Paracoccaceae bacterium]
MTFIELATTIVILGSLLFMTLRGTVAIESMRAIAVGYQLTNYQQAVLGYQVEYRQLPGDDPNASTRWKRNPAMTLLDRGSSVSLAGNGQIDGQLYDPRNPASETLVAWQDLRLGGKLDGDILSTGIASLPENPFGGFYAFDEGNLGQSAGSLCATRIPGRAAESIDRRIDDGKISTGKLVATSKFDIAKNQHFDAPDSEPYDFEKEYIICVPILP